MHDFTDSLVCSDLGVLYILILKDVFSFLIMCLCVGMCAQITCGNRCPRSLEKGAGSSRTARAGIWTILCGARDQTQFLTKAVCAWHCWSISPAPYVWTHLCCHCWSISPDLYVWTHLCWVWRFRNLPGTTCRTSQPQSRLVIQEGSDPKAFSFQVP